MKLKYVWKLVSDFFLKIYIEKIIRTWYWSKFQTLECWGFYLFQQNDMRSIKIHNVIWRNYKKTFVISRVVFGQTNWCTYNLHYTWNRNGIRETGFLITFLAYHWFYHYQYVIVIKIASSLKINETVCIIHAMSWSTMRVNNQ